MFDIDMPVFSATVYGCAAFSYAMLSVLLLKGRRDRRLGMWLLAACGAASLRAVLLAIHSYRQLPLPYIYFAELIFAGLWLLLLLKIGRGGIPRFLLTAVYLLLAGLAIFEIATLTIPSLSSDARFGFRVFVSSGLLLALAGLVLLEQIYRNASQAARYGLRYLVLALGIWFTFDIFMYAEADMIRGVTHEAWAMRGVVLLVTAPLLGYAMRKNAEWLADIFVSREVVFYTATVLAVGVYLLLMAIGGYYIRSLNNNWALALEAAFFVAAGGILILLLSSSMLRRHLQVFISKHFYSNKYDYRIQWLKFNETLANGAKDNVYRAAVQAVAQAIESPGGILYVTTESGARFYPAALWPASLGGGASLPDLDGDDELVRFLDHRTWVIDLVEYRRDPNLYNNCRMPQWLLDDERIRIVSPILELGRLVGFFALHSPPAPFELTYEDRDLLKTIGSQVATQIAQQRADIKLAENRQFEVFNRLAAFTMHDLKNCIAQLKLMMSNAEQHKHNPEFIDDAFATVNNVTARMTNLMNQLQRGDVMIGSAQIDIGKVVGTAVERCCDRLPTPKYERRVESLLVDGDYEQLVNVVEHLIRNAQDATPTGGSIELKFKEYGARIELEITDTGCGMDAEFIRQRLFRPFDSTKGSKGMGIGVYQAREYVRRVGGEMEVSSSPGQGTKFSIILPRWMAHAEPTTA